MSEISINELLPTEILIKILKYLRWPATKNAATTCKLWRVLTDDSCLWSVTLRYQMHPGPAKFHFLRTTNRKFDTIKMYGDLRKIEMEDLGLIERLGLTAVTLIWIGNQFSDISKFVQVLHHLPNLKHISLFDSVVDDYYDYLPDLCKLKNLELSDCEGNILKVFQRARLKWFKLRLDRRIPMGLREFLVSQQDVHATLIVEQRDSRASRKFSFSDLSTLNFKLTNLSLCLCGDQSRGILQLLQSNAETLIELEVGGWFDDDIYVIVFTKLKKLKSLKMRVSKVPKDIKFYERLDISYLNDLTLMGSPVCSEYFFMRLPNITNLTLLCCRKHFLKSIAGQLSNLTTLSLDTGDQLATDQIILPSMTSLHIRKLRHKIDWDEFTKDNNQLTELIIDIVERREILSILDMECITENTSLRVLIIGNCFSASEDMLTLIRCNCPLLRVLSLGSDNFSCVVGDH